MTATDQPRTGVRGAAMVPGGAVLPLPRQRSGSIARITMQESVYAPAAPTRPLGDDPPNVVVILIDDAGPGLPAPLGGEVTTPALARLLAEGVAFNRFHTTAMCSPTRASLLTGRNQHRVGFGQITEFANDWDGYAGRIPDDCATLPQILRHYGYATAGFGKWHNTPAKESTAAGPFDNWPTSLGFEYFYGFLGGEASQYEPNLVRNTTVVLPPKTPEEGYHLSEDLADDAIRWLRDHASLRPDDPFFLYWASGAIHGPHHVANEWADRYAGRFDDGWDAYRERAFERAKERGWIPPDAELTERDPALPGWDDIPDAEKPFQARLMEVAAGFAEHVDTQAARVLDTLDELGCADNTLVLYIWGDNGSSGEGQGGTISELLAQNGIASTVGQHIETLEQLGGLEVLGSPLVDNMYHAGWAWAGSAPYKGMKLLASHLGGTRNPLVVRWPRNIEPDARPRTQFTHCNDITPTVLDVLGLVEPSVVDGVRQQPMDGVSFAYAIDDPHAPGRLTTQYFEVMGSRGIYHEGWYACARGPRLPWVPGLPPGIADWDPDEDVWELYHLDEDWSQAHDLASQEPARLAHLKDLFLVESARNGALPVGGGLWTMILHPEHMLRSSATSWNLFASTTRVNEAVAPPLGRVSTDVAIDVTVPELADGVLYKLGGGSGGLTLYCDQGRLTYEYNLFLIERTTIRAADPLRAGDHLVEVRSRVSAPTRDATLHVELLVDGTVVASGTVPRIAAVAFTANDGLDVGRALGSPVSLAYRDRAPFPFTGTIRSMRVRCV